MSRSSSATVAALLSVRSAVLLDVDPTPSAPDDDGLLVLSNLSGTMQLCEWRAGRLAELTRLPESVSDAAYLPAPGTDGARRVVLSASVGGNERDQLYLLSLDPAGDPVTDFDALDALTADPEHGHHLAGVSPDGHSIAYTSNRANGIDFDLWLVDLETREHRLLWAGGGWCHPGSGFSPDGRHVSVLRSGERPLDHDLVLVDVATGTAHMPLAHPEEAALVGAPAWIDGNSFYATSNVGRDFAAVVRHDLRGGGSEVVADTGTDADAEWVRVLTDGTLVIVENRACATPISLLAPDGGVRTELSPGTEPGVAASYALPGPMPSADGRRLYFTLTTPRRAAEVYRYDLDARVTTQLTHSPSEVEPEDLSPAELATVTAPDGESIEVFLHRPAPSSAPAPVVIIVHGGPESQSQLSFNPVAQALVSAGFGVVVPNVRGSTGYGRRFAALDDTVRRLDSVADLAAVHAALPELGFDPARAALWGGSYGGYMVLAGVSMQPQLWAAGVDIVGISDLVTFLQNTSAYRRAHREREYGSLEHDHDFLVRASPMTHVESIRAPLFVIHGRNDPRVPVGEAEQLAANLRAREVQCELVIYDDEGHGLSRLANRLDAYPRAITFLQRVLGLS